MAEKVSGLGIIGAGQMGTRHAANAVELPEFQVRATRELDLVRKLTVYAILKPPPHQPKPRENKSSSAETA